MKKYLVKYSTLFVIAIVIGIIVNQVAIQYYLNIYLNVPLLGKFYNPINAYKISLFFYNHNATYEQAGENIVIATCLGIFLAYVAGLVIHRKLFGKRLYSDRHGTARFATTKEIMKSNMVNDPTKMDKIEKRYGIIVGSIESPTGRPIARYDTKKKMKLQLLSHFAAQHVLLIAPTGGGKGVGVVTPTLLNYPDSVFMYDIKGADWIKTSGYRAKYLNNICLKFEAINNDGSSCKFNPMDVVRVGTQHEVKDAGNLAVMLIDTDGKGFAGDHWRTSAVDLLTGVILHILYTKKNKNLNSVTRFISGIDPDTDNAYGGDKNWLGEMMGETGMSHLEAYSQYRHISKERAKTELGDLIDEMGINKVVKTSASKLYFKDGKAEGERSSIISSTNAPLSLYNDPIIALNTATSSFKLTDFQTHKKAVSLYVVVAPTDQERLNPLIRILITQIINTVQATELGKNRELLFLLDEFAKLKRMDVVEAAMATIRSFKARFLLVIQDVAQLKNYYGDLAASIFSNAGIRIAFASNEESTQNMLAKMTGDKTYVAETISTAVQRAQGWGFGGSVTTTTSKQESVRTLMTPNEIARLGDNALIFVEGKNAILGKTYNYREDQEMLGRTLIPASTTSKW